MQSRRKSSETQASTDSSSIACPTDGAGHGKRSRRATVSDSYVIRDLSLRESDISTDADSFTMNKGRRGQMGQFRSKSAPRMCASQRLRLRQTIQGDEEKKIDVDSSDDNECINNLNVKSNNNEVCRCKEGNELHDRDNNEILSDFIQLKLELAELQSKLQHIESNAKTKIEALQSQNITLEKDNTNLIKRNKQLQEENDRLSQCRWLGIGRRASEVTLKTDAPSNTDTDETWNSSC